MKILITGISGIIGNIMAKHFLAHGHTVIGISRHPRIAAKKLPETITIIDWSALTPEFFQIRQIDAIINLSGAPMIQKWNRHTKPNILNSRQSALETIYGVVRRLSPSNRPQSIIYASSIAIYSTQIEPVDESFQPDLDINFFQSLVWQKLEKSIRKLSIPDVRTVIARIGLVIGPYDLMRTLLTCSRYYSGAVIGSGNQKISWISHHDLARSFDRFIADKTCNGTYNVVAPEIVTARKLSVEIARSINRPVWLRIPDRALRLLLGELADNFLVSAPVKPTRLKEASFRWNIPDFNSAVVQALWELNASETNSLLVR